MIFYIEKRGDNMNFTELLQTFGFPVACVACLGFYIAKVQAEQRADSKEREEKLLTQFRRNVRYE